MLWIEIHIGAAVVQFFPCLGHSIIIIRRTLMICWSWFVFQLECMNWPRETENGWWITLIQWTVAVKPNPDEKQKTVVAAKMTKTRQSSLWSMDVLIDRSRAVFIWPMGIELRRRARRKSGSDVEKSSCSGFNRESLSLRECKALVCDLILS